MYLQNELFLRYREWPVCELYYILLIAKNPWNPYNFLHTTQVTPKTITGIWSCAQLKKINVGIIVLLFILYKKGKE